MGPARIDWMLSTCSHHTVSEALRLWVGQHPDQLLLHGHKALVLHIQEAHTAVGVPDHHLILAWVQQKGSDLAAATAPTIQRQTYT